MRCFLSTDMDLNTQMTLEYYSKRWPIEIFFRQTNGNFGINQYQVRHLKASNLSKFLERLKYNVGETPLSSFLLSWDD